LLPGNQPPRNPVDSRKLVPLRVLCLTVRAGSAKISEIFLSWKLRSLLPAFFPRSWADHAG
jgi:hypothetical protein